MAKSFLKKHGKYPQKFKKRQHVNFKSQTYGNSTSNLWEPGSRDPRILEVCRRDQNITSNNQKMED